MKLPDLNKLKVCKYAKKCISKPIITCKYLGLTLSKHIAEN